MTRADRRIIQFQLVLLASLLAFCAWIWSVP